MLGTGIKEYFSFGLSQYIPFVLYGLSFLVAFLTVFYKSGIGILFLIPLFPIYAVLDKVLKSGLFLANSVTDMIIIGMILGWMVQERKEHEPNIGQAPQLAPVFLFMSFSLTSFVLGTSYLGDDFSSDITFERLAFWKNYMIMPLIYVIAFYNLRERKWKYALYILLFFSFVAMNYKFRLNFRWMFHTHYAHESRGGDTFAFLNANVWGAFHAMYILFLAGLFLIDKHRWRRLAYLILIYGCGYSLIYSYSRGAYVGLVAGLFFIAIVRERKLLIPLFIFFLVWKLILPISVVERIEGTFVTEGNETSVLRIGDTQLETAGRSGIWDEALSLFSEHPITGTGFRTFGEKTGMDTHNEYLKTLAEDGIIGLFIYLLLYYRALKSGWQLYKTADEELLKAFGFGFLCSVVGSMVVNFFGDRWSYLQVGGIYWVTWALVDQENNRLRIQRQELAALSGGESTNLTRILDSRALR